MSDKNSETTNNTWQPDPAWDYYILWHSLRHIKAKIDATLILMQREECAMPDLDINFKKILDPASRKLIEIIDLLPDHE